MFKFSGGVDVRQSYMFKVMGGGAGASAMFKVMGGSAGASAMFKVMGGVSAMFKVMAVSRVQGDDREGGVRGISHVQGDGRG